MSFRFNLFQNEFSCRRTSLGKITTFKEHITNVAREITGEPNECEKSIEESSDGEIFSSDDDTYVKNYDSTILKRNPEHSSCDSSVISEQESNTIPWKPYQNDETAKNANDTFQWGNITPDKPPECHWGQGEGEGQDKGQGEGEGQGQGESESEDDKGLKIHTNLSD